MESVSKEKILKTFSFEKGGTYLMLYRHDTNIRPSEVQDICGALSDQMDIHLYCLGVFDLDYIKFADLKKIKIKE